MNLKNILINTIISLIIPVVVFLLIVLILNNIDKLVGIFSKNTYVISYFKDIAEAEKTYPIPFVFILFIINVGLSIFRSKQKIILTILLVIINIAAFVGIFMFTKVDKQYVLQIIEELKSYL